MVNLNIQVNTIQAQRFLDRVKSEARSGAADTVDDLANYAKFTARSEAPRLTGRTAQNIRKHTTGSLSRSVVAHPSSRNRHVNLPAWMHNRKVESAGYFPANKPEDHIQSGNPKFMDAAKIKAERVAEQFIEQNIDISGNTLR